MRDYTFEVSPNGEDRSRNWLVKECISEHPNDEASAHESFKGRERTGPSLNGLPDKKKRCPLSPKK